MKKIMILCVGLLALASCKKDWTCQCTSSLGDATSSTTITDQTRADAKVTCDEGDGSALGITVDCELQ